MSELSYAHTPMSVPKRYVTINTILKRLALENPDKELFIQRFMDGGRKTLTTGDLYNKAHKLAAFLNESGIVKGDRLLVVGPNSMEWIIAEIGVLLSGAVAIHATLSTKNADDLKEIIVCSKSKGILLDAKGTPELLDSMSALKPNGDSFLVVSLNSASRDSVYPDFHSILSKSVSSDVSLPEVCPEDPMAVYTTSGSTGKPKMVVHTHSDITSLISFSSHPAFKGATKFFNDRPFGWAGGLILDSISYDIARVYIDSSISMSPENVEFIWNIICEEQVSYAALFPFILRDVMNMKTENSYKLKAIITGGQLIDPIYFKTVGNMTDALAILYGSTEIFAVAMGAVCSSKESREVGDVGAILPGVEVKIVDAFGNPTVWGESGSVYVRSPRAFSGYLEDPESTVNAFDINRWYVTGDIGKLVRTDGEVRLILQGREKDVISRGTRKILPENIERVVNQIPGITEVVVLGVPDKRLLEEICVCFSADDTVTKQHVQNYCEDQLKPSQQGDGLGLMPKYFLKYDSLPVLHTGKVDKRTLKQLCIEQLKICTDT